MSTAPKMPLAEAEALAKEFQAQFHPDAYTRWEIAGSIRRRRPEVGDVECVIIPAFGTMTVADGLFPKEVPNVNLLWGMLDAHVEAGRMGRWKRNRQCAKCSGQGKVFRSDVGKCLNCEGRGYVYCECWGEKMRAVEFRGRSFEIYTASPNTWGSTMAIRTGPWEFSKRLVSAFPARGLRAEDGYLRRGVELLPCPDEKAYMAAAGFAWIAPERRV